MKQKKIDEYVKKMQQIKNDIDELASEFENEESAMQDYFDNRSEAWQEGDKGEAFNEQMVEVSEIRDGLECLSNDLDDIVSRVEGLAE